MPQPANDGSDIRRASGLDQQHLNAILDGSREGAFGSAPTAAVLLETSEVRIAYVVGRPVGCIATTIGTPPILHALIVVSDERAKGHACSLIEAALAGISPECEVVWTAVDPNLLGAKERFAKHGFDVHAYSNHGTLLLMTRQHRARGRSPWAAPNPADERLVACG